MRSLFPRITGILKDSGINFFAMFPCEKIAGLYDLISRDEAFRHIYLTREEEGVGICAGASLAGSRPAMLIQSSGIGNMVNALSSLTQTYRLPLLILASWRGVHDEKIPAQVPLGRHMPRLLESLEIDYSIIDAPEKIHLVGEAADRVYCQNEIHVVLLDPKLAEIEGEASSDKRNLFGDKKSAYEALGKREERTDGEKEFTKFRSAGASETPQLTRFEILQGISQYLEGKVVVCNLGIPCKELYQVKHQKSNFYMLGSMGLASSIGLGISIYTSKQVVVIDGDGSLMMNLGALSTIAREGGSNLTILAIDNGVHGSTGSQPTATSYGADLGALARGSGFKSTYREADVGGLLATLHHLDSGPNFVHMLARIGNAKVPNVPLTPIEIKNNVAEAIVGVKG
jgi:sulfopyruvate decarboxylase subunit beta